MTFENAVTRRDVEEKGNGTHLLPISTAPVTALPVGHHAFEINGGGTSVFFTITQLRARTFCFSKRKKRWS